MTKNVGESFKARNIPLKILLRCQFTLRNCNYHQSENLIFNFLVYFLSIKHLKNFDDAR